MLLIFPDKKIKQFQSGFTLVELLIVITIISVISVVAVAYYSGVQKNTRDAVRKSDISAIAQAYEANYNATTGLYTPLTNSQFSANNIPLNPNGLPYFGLISSSSNSFQVCAALEDNPFGSCNTPSADCVCVYSQR